MTDTKFKILVGAVTALLSAVVPMLVPYLFTQETKPTAGETPDSVVVERHRVAYGNNFMQSKPSGKAKPASGTISAE